MIQATSATRWRIWSSTRRAGARSLRIPLARRDSRCSASRRSEGVRRNSRATRSPAGRSAEGGAEVPVIHIGAGEQ